MGDTTLLCVRQPTIRLERYQNGIATNSKHINTTVHTAVDAMLLREATTENNPALHQSRRGVVYHIPKRHCPCP